MADLGSRPVNLRVRDLGEVARLEIDAELLPLPAATEAQLRELMVAAGFEALEVDPRGFRSGAMNELLAEPERWR